MNFNPIYMAKHAKNTKENTRRNFCVQTCACAQVYLELGCAEAAARVTSSTGTSMLIYFPPNSTYYWSYR